MLNTATIFDVSKRVIVLLVGCFLGVGLVTPNIMMADSGKNWALISASIGVMACFCFVVGGIVYCFFFDSLVVFLPGLALQLLALSGLACRGFWKLET